MIKKPTVFWASLIIIAIGSVWTAAVFASSIKGSEGFDLDKAGAGTMSLALHGKGIGFYQIASDQYDNSILVKVIDSQGNYLTMKTITNKQTVNYFFYEKTGQYTLEFTNLSPNPVHLSIEFGDTNYQKFGLSSSLVLVGVCLLVLAGYLRLKGYITAQPE